MTSTPFSQGILGWPRVICLPQSAHPNMHILAKALIFIALWTVAPQLCGKLASYFPGDPGAAQLVTRVLVDSNHEDSVCNRLAEKCAALVAWERLGVLYVSGCLACPTTLRSFLEAIFDISAIITALAVDFVGMISHMLSAIDYMAKSDRITWDVVGSIIVVTLITSENEKEMAMHRILHNLREARLNPTKYIEFRPSRSIEDV